MGVKLSLNGNSGSQKEVKIRRMKTVIQEDYEAIGAAHQQNSHSADQFKKKKGIVTGLSRTSVDHSSPFKKKNTNLSIKYTIADDLEEGKEDINKNYFARMPSPKGSKGYIEDIGSVQALLGSSFFVVDPISPRRYLRFNADLLEQEHVDAIEAIIKKTKDTASKLKLFVHSQIPMDGEKPFEEKSYKVQVLELDNQAYGSKQADASEDDTSNHMTTKHYLKTIGISITCRKGNCREGSNQDNYFCYVDSISKIFIITDGHGPFGDMVSFFVAMNMAKSIVESALFLTDTEAALEFAFQDCHKQLLRLNEMKNRYLDTALSGSSATVVIIKEGKVHIGHLGDIKVMLGRRSKNKKSINLHLLTNDHVPAVAEEKKRIYEKGGEVRRTTTSLEEKIFVRGRVYPCLSTTRSLGDDIGRLVGVIHKPDILTYEMIPGSDIFLMMGTDSFFTFLEDNEILNVLNFAYASTVEESTEILIKKAKNCWVQAGNNYEDLTLALCYF